ncbi:MAG: Phenylalanyl-tRNA synthetase, beta subunit, cytoplasmic [Chaenotheca gracillima]|nr:MAG: Phenylalanyl-tRNA synthetase, beta subunit, cytoplasmic [Chaenotheca gracillima]
MQFSVATFLSIVTAAGLASAYTTPVGDSPVGNPISKPGLAEQVPAGKVEKITWNPTTKGTVTILLLRGPSNDVKPLYPIAEKIPNTGSYSWTPSTKLDADTTHYGLQLIDDATGHYQYSTQFGISKSKDVIAHEDAGGPSTSTAPATPGTAITGTTISGTGKPTASPTVTAHGTGHGTGLPVGTGTAGTPGTAGTAGTAASTGGHHTSMVSPTGPMTVPSTLRTAASTADATGAATATSAAASASKTGAAGRTAVSFGSSILAAFGVAVALL